MLRIRCASLTHLPPSMLSLVVELATVQRDRSGFGFEVLDIEPLFSAIQLDKHLSCSI